MSMPSAPRSSARARVLSSVNGAGPERGRSM
ncbi:hypothetical protein ABID21_005015 [Pseudorhizobium tarimense]|uniref:Uncharacterized protein n=1 Tax=Pseudorhizobium tarimense TaxID=1079109 RepID=A0ABV2HE98_9HYPH